MCGVPPTRLRILLWIVAVGVALAGCGGESQEAQFKKATERVREARQRVEELRAKVEEKEQRFEAAEEELEAAREKLREAQQAEAQARDELSQTATDDLLFREVQKRLLEDERLQKVAIRARVEGAIAYLSGDVPEAELRNRAVEVAERTPGIVAVESRIQVTRRAEEAEEESGSGAGEEAPGAAGSGKPEPSEEPGEGGPGKTSEPAPEAGGEEGSDAPVMRPSAEGT